MVLGLFKSKRKIYVASSVYNLAGEVEDRPHYLKTTVMGSVLRDRSRGWLGESIVKSQLAGPAINQQSFFRWARLNYPEGELRGKFDAKSRLDQNKISEISSVLPTPPDHTLEVQDAYIDFGNIYYWAERHILQTRPEDYQEDWNVDYDPDLESMIISYPSGPNEIVLVPDFDPEVREYLFIHYLLVRPDTMETWQIGVETQELNHIPILAGEDPVWNTSQTVLQSISVPLTRTEIVTVNGVAETTQTNHNQTFEGSEITYLRTVPQGPDALNARYVSQNQRLTVTKKHQIQQDTYTSTETVDGVTTSVTVTTEFLVPRWENSLDTQVSYRYDMTGTQDLYIYPLGSGNELLDNMVVEGSEVSDFFPVLPIRLVKKYITDDDYSELSGNVERAYRKIMGQKIDALIEQLDDNEHIDDLDHAFLVFGVEANTKDKHGKRYIYEFFRTLQGGQQTLPQAIEDWGNNNEQYAGFLDQMHSWEEAQLNTRDAQFGAARPSWNAAPAPEFNTFTLRVPYKIPTSSEVGWPFTSTSKRFSYKTSFSWVHIKEVLENGLGKRNARRGDLWWEVLPEVTGDGTWTNTSMFVDQQEQASVSKVRLYWQYDARRYKYLEIHGMTHSNIVYKGHSVTIPLTEALADEEDSGFVVPMHYDTLRTMPLVAKNELFISNKLLVLNSYQVVMVKWYQRGIFRLLLTILIIVISAVIFPGAIGLLGPNMAVGVALGFAAGSMTALIMGAIANALAAMALSAVISKAATSIFGEKFGAIIAAIVTFFAFQMVGNLFAGGGLTFNWSNLMRIDNLIRLTDVLGGGISGWAQAGMREIDGELQNELDTFKERTKEIQKLTRELIGDSGDIIDPLWLLEQQSEDSNSAETLDSFISRTLLTGSDLIEIQHEMIDRFAEYTLALDGPFE